MKVSLTDTIAALATPRGSGGIGIIKISGPDALDILGRIFRPARAIDDGGSPPAEHQRLTYGHIVHPREGMLDEVLVSIMLGPRSYTTEDVVEINCHGGVVITQAVLDLVLEQGARSADPGEFTRRAFLGGRINLVQAEAVIDIINAKTRRAARTGLQNIAHGIDQQVGRLQDLLFNALAEIEAFIDFDDDLEEGFSLAPLADRLGREILPAIESLIESYRGGRILREGLRIVIAGRPNVGKSSLVNLLLNQDRVIVNPSPGTTRDIIEEMIAIEGAPVVITDTAGIHASDDPVEAIGIEKTKSAIERADLVLFMIDASKSLQPEDQGLYQSLKNRAHLIVHNKIDLTDNPAVDLGLQDADGHTPVRLSALTGEGLETLRQRIMASVGIAADPSGSALVVNARQRNLLAAAQTHLRQAAALLEKSDDAEIVALEIRDGLEKLNEIKGEGANVDVLDHIFSRFCIGK